MESLPEGIRILIHSGEGETGSCEPYTGAWTERALRARLARERCGGDRWARAWYTTGDTDGAGMLIWHDVDSSDRRSGLEVS